MPDDNIVQLRPTEPTEPRIWTCHCGCRTFELYEDGHTECALCGQTTIDENDGWAKIKKAATDATVDTPVRNVDQFDTADFAKASILKSIDNDTVAIVVIWPTGYIRGWSVFSNYDTPERKDWVKHTLSSAATLLIGGEPIGTDDLPEKPE